MQFLLDQWVNSLRVFLGFLPLIIGAVRWFRLPTAQRLLLTYVGLMVTYEVLSLFFFRDAYDTSVLYNLILIAQIVLAGTAYYFLIADSWLQKIGLILIGTALLFSLLNLLGIQGLQIRNSYTEFALAAMLLVLGLFYLHSHDYARGPLHLGSSLALLTVALMAQALCNSFYLGYLDVVIQEKPTDLTEIIVIQHVYQMLFYLVVSIALWVQPKNKRTPFSYSS